MTLDQLKEKLESRWNQAALRTLAQGGYKWRLVADYGRRGPQFWQAMRAWEHYSPRAGIAIVENKVNGPRTAYAAVRLCATTPGESEPRRVWSIVAWFSGKAAARQARSWASMMLDVLPQMDVIVGG